MPSFKVMPHVSSKCFSAVPFLNTIKSLMLQSLIFGWLLSESTDGPPSAWACDLSRFFPRFDHTNIYEYRRIPIKTPIILHPSKCCERQKSIMGNQGSFDRVFKSICITWDWGAAVEGAAISPCIDFLFGKPNYGKLCSDGLSNYRTLSHVPNSKRRIQNWSHNWSLCQFLWPWSALYRP